MKYEATVIEVVREAPNISTVFFTVEKPFCFTAGQYISVYFEQTNKKAGKAYSLSNAPSDKYLSITVKNIGEFSGLICNLKPGDKFTISSPFGFFNVNDNLPIVAIAAGVGISPIWSIIKNELLVNNERDISLYLTAPTLNELVFKDKINKLFAGKANARQNYFATQEKINQDLIKNHRFSVSRDISKKAIEYSRFYICGSEEFVRSIWQNLMEAGVDENRVVSETFFESSP